ncbi:MAG: ComF family protein [Candidatus Acidiferrales bacterium]
MIFRNALDALSSILFPAPCRICGNALAAASRIPICKDCLDSFVPIGPPMCARCGRPFVSPMAAEADRPLCRLCRAEKYGFDSARSFAQYDEKLTAAILLLKYEEIHSLGKWFAARLREVMAADEDVLRADVVVPVPLHPDRLRERGYNQAEMIAAPLARQLNLKLRAYLLVRTIPRPPRLHLSRRERWESVRGAYAISKGVQVDNLRILLVDDVMTTGATLDACARALKRAGAAKVFALTVGRAVSGLAAAVPPKQRNTN